MRTVSADITNAITLPASHRQSARLTVYKSRAYFDELTSSHAPSDAKAIGYTGIRLNEASFLLNGDVVTFYVNSSDILYAMLEGNSTPIQLLTGVDKTCRIGVNPNSSTGVYSLYYFNNNSSRWEYRHINTTQLLARNSSCLSSVVNTFSTLNRGAIYPLIGTTNTFVLLDIYEGAVRVGIYDDNKDTTPNKYRFINPLRVLSASSDDIYLLHKAGAALVGNKVFVYYSHYDGSVKSMICTLNSDMRHGVWSDIRVAIPQDLSIFDVVNVFSWNQRVFISGNFYRTSQFASAAKYALLAWSDDGITFTMNRRVLFSAIELPFHVHTDGSEIVFTSTNRINKSTAPYQVVGENADKTVTEVVSITGNIGAEISVTVASGSEQYFDNTKIDTGSYAKLETSIVTANGKEYIHYLDGVVSSIDKAMKDGGRGNTINIMADANWHTSVMTQPFYMEFQGKQTIYDPCSDFSNMYKASTNISPEWNLSAEFYDPGNATFSVHTHKNATTRHWTRDLSDLYMSYPLFGSTNFYTVKVYGWSRAGLPSTTPNTPDPTNVNTLNDAFYPVLEYQDNDGKTHTYKCTDADLVSPSNNHPPQTYFINADGSYPVVFTFPNPGEGFEITHLGCDVTSRSADNTTYYLERIEMPDIAVSVIVNDLASATFTINNMTLKSTNDKSYVKYYMANKKKGIPQLLFSTKPYSAWNFELTSRVMFWGPYTETGLVGLAVDEQNFVAGIITKTKVKIVKMSYGKKTVLEAATISLTEGSQYDLRFWHRDGVLGYEYKLSTDVWPTRGSVLQHIWKSIDGPMAIQDDLYHVGAYSFINPPAFRIIGMRSGETVIAAMPSDASLVNQFPSTGDADIDGLVYSYTGKSSHFVTNPALGPYQIVGYGKNKYPYNKDLDGSFTYLKGTDYVDVTISKNLSGVIGANYYVGAILGTSGGKSFVISEIQWKSWHKVNGVVVKKPDEAKIYSSGLKTWAPTVDERVYITDGLTGVKPKDVDKEKRIAGDAADSNSYMHCPGVFCYIDHSDESRLLGFQATSGDHDQTIHLLLGLFCKLAGTSATFLGDKEYSQAITDGQEITL